MIRVALLYLTILVAIEPAAQPHHVAVMFLRSTDAVCRRDLWKIKVSGNESKLQYVDIDRRPDQARKYKIVDVPTYIIWEQQGTTYKEVFRTHDLRELDRVTKGRR